MQSVTTTTISALPFRATSIDLDTSYNFPETSIIAHAPGWTLFRNLYMSNGTLLILTSQTDRSSFPEIRMMTSTGLPASNTPENIASREPTEQDMTFIAPDQARRKWGGDSKKGEKNRVWSLEGHTLLYNDPPQFINHYYHFVAELFFGTWAFIHGAFDPSSGLTESDSIVFYQSSFDPHAEARSHPPPLTRAIFIHAPSDSWRDAPGFNGYFLRAAFPSLSVEGSADWGDRVSATHAALGSEEGSRAWHFPLVMFADRSAAHRGEACGSRTQRTAAEPWELMVEKGAIDLAGEWWGHVRGAVLRFAGAEVKKREAQVQNGTDGNVQLALPPPEKVAILYIVRQGIRRHLIEEDHEGLVSALKDMVRRKKHEEDKEWELDVVKAELLTRDEQLRLAGKATILLGVHGNGLTHLVFMQPTRVSAVVEIFYPGGFCRDYEWTARALGMRHFSVWNNTFFTHPYEPELAYPDGFQGTEIPVHGPSVAKLIEDRLEGRL